MIKKISTLFLTLVALLGTTNVFAQSVGHDDTGLRYNLTPHGLNARTPVNGLTGTGFFHLAIEDGAGVYNRVLAINGDGELVIVNLSTTLPANTPFGNTLWCVDVTQENQGQTPVYDFINKGAQMALDIPYGGVYEALAVSTATPAAANLSGNPVQVGGEIAGWTLSPQYLSQMEAGPMFSSYQTDYVIGFVVNGNTVDVAKYPFNVAVAGDTEFTDFRLVEAARMQLTADEINTVINTQADGAGVTLKFNPNVDSNRENPFTDYKFFAKPATSTVTTGNELVNIFKLKADGTRDYLRADSAYINTTGIKFLDYAWTDSTQMVGEIANNYNFLFTYSPSYDSLYIQIERVIVKDDNQTWGNLSPAVPNSNNFVTWPYVSIQNLESVKLFTVGNDQNSYISFGIPDCQTSTDRISLAEDLYIIRNGNQYLAVPIHGRGEAQWVTIDAKDNMQPWNMPAYQWIVEKNLISTDPLKAISPVRITNREYSEVVLGGGSVQFYNSGNSTVSLVAYDGTPYTISLNANYFEADSNNVKSERLLGYKMFDQNAVVQSYKLNYLHGLGDDTYLTLDGSVLNADLDGGIEFIIEEDPYQIGNSLAGSVLPAVRDTTYGATSTRIPGMVKLNRKAYRLKVKNTNNYVYVDSQNRYAVTNAANGVPSIFYLKENNYKGKSYYALVDIRTNATLYASQLSGADESEEYWKLGVDDVSLDVKAQTLYEDRTSTFAVVIDDTPLYRRFNTSDEMTGDNPTDTTVYLQFHSTYRTNEVLQIEANDQEAGVVIKGIDFLGMWTVAEAPNGTSFRVDTAWVNRSLGYIKPQYLISIERNDFGGQPARPCEDDYHGYAPDGTPYNQWTCPHAIPAVPAFERGKYLVNFGQINYTAGKADYRWKNQVDRAGFVHAIKQNDTIWVLSSDVPEYDFYKFDNTTANIDAIKAAANVTTNNNVQRIRLDNDDHKGITWSMRYLDPEAAKAGEKKFIIESMNANSTAVTVGSTTYPVGTVGRGEIIAPEAGQWIKLQNGVITLTDPRTSRFSDMANSSSTSGDDAMLFDVRIGSEDDKPLDNTEVEVSGVTVIAETGAVVIKNAAGKKVAISNILGQTVANTVITSDNATIAVPQGVVVVAVEGETAVKAIVK